MPVDQEPYDFIEPNPEEDNALSEGDGQQSVGPYISCIKVRHKKSIGSCMATTRTPLTSLSSAVELSAGEVLSYHCLFLFHY